jgi:two-component system chemotaxis response regulator CheB
VRPLRLVVVEDSPTQALHLRSLLLESGFQVVGTPTTVAEAEEVIGREHPDLVLSDVRLPGADGIELTRRLLARRGMPVVLITAHDPRNPTLIFQAMEAGALEVLPKPPGRADPGIGGYRRELERTLRLLATTPVIRRLPARAQRAEPAPQPDPGEPPLDLPLLAIGASTGGPPVIAEVLRGLRGRRVGPVVVIQHIMAEFTESLRAWLANVAERPARLAEAGALAEAGVVHVAPARCHLRLGPDRRWQVLSAESLPHVHVPSVDELFGSLAAVAPRQTIALLLTGMGSDGAAGLLCLHEAGAWTVAQRPDTAIVDGMPRSAIERGAARQVLPPEEMVALLQRLPGA